MVTKIGRYPGIGGNREYTAGFFGFFFDIGQHRSKICHTSFTSMTPSGGRVEAVRRPSGNRTASVSKNNFIGGRRGSEYRTSI